MVSTGFESSSTRTSTIAPEGRHEHEEPEDILSAFLGVVYDYAPITYSEAGSTFTYTYPGLRRHADVKGAPSADDEEYQWTTDPITLTLHTPDTQARNWELHASSIWAAAVFLADHIDELKLDRFMHLSRSDEQDIRSGGTFRVLELGAGAGLPGLLIAKYLERIERDSESRGEDMKEWRITLSDYPDELLIETLRRNVQRNYSSGSDHSQVTDTIPKCIHVVPYAWGEDISALISSQKDDAEGVGFDLIVAADTLWNAALHDIFAQTIYFLLRRTPDARVHLVAGLHTGRYALSGFLRTVRSIHVSQRDNTPKPRLDVLDISEREVNDEARRDWREDRDGEDDMERRRWLVWIVLGWVDLRLSP
ncbi:hypothetical protein ACEPAI_4119 [Sanghuangporus weigelae]